MKAAQPPVATRGERLSWLMPFLAKTEKRLKQTSLLLQVMTYSGGSFIRAHLEQHSVRKETSQAGASCFEIPVRKATLYSHIVGLEAGVWSFAGVWSLTDVWALASVWSLTVAWSLAGVWSLASWCVVTCLCLVSGWCVVTRWCVVTHVLAYCV